MVYEEGVSGFDLRAIAAKTIAMYDLKLETGIMVDYWSSALQMYILCDDLFSDISESKRLISVEDLIFCEPEYGLESKKCILLRLKNSTGNTIRLDMETPNVRPLEIAQSKLALSIDDQFKNQRSRTVQQVLNMVLRWRIISNGYYDF